MVIYRGGPPYGDLGLGQMVVDWEDQRVNPERMHRERVGRVQKILKQREVDAVFCFAWENVRYLTGFRFHLWPVIRFGFTEAILGRGMDNAILYTMDDDHVRARMSWVKDTVRFAAGSSIEDPVAAKKWVDETKKELSDAGIEPKKIAVDAWAPTIYEVLPKAYPDVKFVNGADLMADAKKIKTEDEIKCMKIACSMTVRGMGTAVDLIHNKKGIKECEVLSAAFKEMYDLGSEWTQCSNIVCSGPYTFPYRRFTSDRIIEPGDFVIVDIGACYNGYYADFTRVWIAGGVEPIKEQKEVFMKSYNALDAAVEACKPGATTWDVYQAAYAAGGLHGGFLGHSDGLGALEPPYLADFSRDNPEKIEPGMIFSIEPFAGKVGIGGVRLEHNVLVKPDGNEIISRYPFEESLFIK